MEIGTFFLGISIIIGAFLLSVPLYSLSSAIRRNSLSSLAYEIRETRKTIEKIWEEQKLYERSRIPPRNPR